MQIKKLPLFALMFLFYGCGEDTTPAPNPNAEEVFPFSCTTGKQVEQGNNKDWKVDGIKRRFYADLPDVDDTTKVAVVFSFYGIYDIVENWRRTFSPDPNIDPDFPFIHIIFSDTNMSPTGDPQGLAWDMFVSAEGDDNREALLFETVLGCLQKQFVLDNTHVYAFGFSGGAIVSNMLHSRYPEYLGAIVSSSGAWFNDPAQVALVTAPFDVTYDWTPIEENIGTALITHGGPNDTYSFLGSQVINFEDAAQLAKPFLTAHTRTVIDCPHTEGHDTHPNLSSSDIIQFFKEHQAGVASGYPANFPTMLSDIGCTLVN